MNKTVEIVLIQCNWIWDYVTWTYCTKVAVKYFLFSEYLNFGTGATSTTAAVCKGDRQQTLQAVWSADELMKCSRTTAAPDKRYGLETAPVIFPLNSWTVQLDWKVESGTWIANGKPGSESLSVLWVFECETLRSAKSAAVLDRLMFFCRAPFTAAFASKQINNKAQLNKL